MNDTFNKLPTTVNVFLLSDNPELLQEVLKYHLVPGTINAGAILDRTIATMQTLVVNKTLSFTINGGTISINAGATNVERPNVCNKWSFTHD